MKRLFIEEQRLTPGWRFCAQSKGYSGVAVLRSAEEFLSLKVGGGRSRELYPGT